MNSTAKHPVTLSQLLKTSWYHYKVNFITILILTLIVQIPTSILDYFTNLYLPVGAPVQLRIVFGLPTTLIGLLSFISINLLIKGVYEETAVSWSDCFKQAFKRYIDYTWISFLILVTAVIIPFLVMQLTTLPSTFLLVPDISPILTILAFMISIAPIVSIIFIFPYLSFPTHAYLFKGVKGIQALKYSIFLVKGRYWLIFF